jgi:pyrroline-5-carboxylate reductase
MTEYKICILGTGNMGEAILKGIITSGLYSKKEIIVTDVAEDRLSYIHER